MSPTIRCSSCPFGPFTRIALPSIVTSTPLGTVIGCLPMRDMPCLPDLTQDLAADATLTRLAVGQQTLIRGQNCDSHAAEDTGDAVGLGVHAQPGSRDALQPRDGPAAVGRVLHPDREALARTG